MSNNKPTQIDLTTNKLAAALEQSVAITPAPAAPAAIEKPKDGAANKNVVKISEKAAEKKVEAKQPEAKKAPAPAAKAKAKVAKKVIAKKPVEKKAAAKEIIAKKPEAKIAAKKATPVKAKKAPVAKKAIKKAVKKTIKTAQKATQKTTNTAKQTSAIEAKAANFAKNSAEKLYAQNAQAFEQLLTAKSANEAFEIQSKLVQNALKQGIENALQLNEFLAQAVSNTFALIAKK